MSAGAAVAPARGGAATGPRRASFLESSPQWYLFFFVSGFPALLYQIVWQRSLFTFYGVNIESVTMVVTAFMLGLGLGSLLGGVVTRYPRIPLLATFGFVELLTAFYGVFSLRIFGWAAEFTAGSSPLKTGTAAFALIVLPTMLMGSTLPILVSYTVRIFRNVGMSVGALYAANTLGSAAACFCAGRFLMRWLGEWKTVALAAGLNAVVGTGVLIYHFLSEDSQSSRFAAEAASEQGHAIAPDTRVKTGGRSDFKFALALAAACIAGFVSLGYEIVWYRLFSFTNGGEAKSFAYLLGAYLAGVGGGSLMTHRFCRPLRNPQTFALFLAVATLGANLLGFLVGPILFYLVTHTAYLWTLMPIGIAAAGLGAIFPLLCHVSILPDERAGARTSYLYLANIIGSALGSYLTGFVLMDILPLRQVSLVLTLLGLALAFVFLLKARPGKIALACCSSGILLVAIVITATSQFLYRDMYEKMLMKWSYPLTTIRNNYLAGPHFGAIVENKSGVITVSNKGVVFGGGVYDGAFNVSLVQDGNWVQRAYALSYFHPDPKEVLMIGLSSGSWAQVVANHPQIEHLTIVEINPGYLSLIKNNPQVASLLRNPKVHIDIDDGRRWLIHNRDRKFDAIIMNTTHNWRCHVSNLLSVEFLQMIRQHLNPGGVHFYNTTDSDEAEATGLKVFPFGMRLQTFMVVSDSPLQLDAQRWRDILARYTIDGEPVFDLSRERDRRRFDEVLSMTTTMDRQVNYPFPLESADHVRSRTAGARIITDDNMGTEWVR